MAPAAYGKHLREVEAALTDVAPDGSAEQHFNYIGGRVSKLTYLGLKVPQVTQVKKGGFSFADLAAKDQLAIWDFIWSKSDCYEAMCLPLNHYGDKKRVPELKAAWPKIKRWVKRIDNWAHSDSLSSIYARILEEDPQLVLPTLKTWSSSKNPWERRQSIVSLIYYSAARKRVLPFKTIAQMVTAQLDHDDYYVQKGVGWTLRELGNVYPDETLAYVRRHLARLSAAAFSAATEKMSATVKADLKKRRVEARRRRV